jgi:hypothetical protein
MCLELFGVLGAPQLIPSRQWHSQLCIRERWVYKLRHGYMSISEEGVKGQPERMIDMSAVMCEQFVSTGYSIPLPRLEFVPALPLLVQHFAFISWIDDQLRIF